MSTINTENLTLYANPYLYNGSRYVFYQTGRDYEAWLRETSTQVTTKTVYFKSLTEEMELNSSPGDILKYPYGKITNDNKSYYIFIDRITTDEHGKSYIKFSVDWWATEWANIHPTKAHLTRKPTKPGYMAQPWTPLKVSSTEKSVTDKFCIMATYIPSEGEGGEGEDIEPSYISTIILPGTKTILKMVEEGYWYQKLEIAGSDIKDCFVVPLYDYDDFVTTQTVYIVNGEQNNENYPPTSSLQDRKDMDGFSGAWCDAYFDGNPEVESDYPSIPEVGAIAYNKFDGKYYECTRCERGVTGIPPKYYWLIHWTEITPTFTNQKYTERVSGYTDGTFFAYKQTIYTDVGNNFWDVIKVIDESFTTDEKICQGLQDWNGDSMWECPYGVTVNGFDVSLLVGLSHIILQFTPKAIVTTTIKLSDKQTGLAFSYDCKHPGLFIDSYQEYVLKNREYDIEMRSIQSEKQVWQAAFSTAENIGFGFAFGQKKGGIAAGAGGLIETIGTFLINQEFDPRIQEQYDNRYKKITDQISLIGDAITNIYNSIGTIVRYDLIMDESTQERMDIDIDVNGYVCDETVRDLESIFNTGVVLQADNVTIEGSTCLDAKQQTVYRLQNGVEFK